jgi:hypothetical protein
VLHVDVRDRLASGAEMRKIPLSNGDEPDFAFRAGTGRESPPAPAPRRAGRGRR